MEMLFPRLWLVEELRPSIFLLSDLVNFLPLAGLDDWLNFDPFCGALDSVMLRFALFCG